MILLDEVGKMGYEIILEKILIGLFFSGIRKLSKKEHNKIEKDIRIIVSEFQSKYENTEIDSKTFSEVLDEIQYDRIITSYVFNNSESMIDFISIKSDEIITLFNTKRKEIEWPEIKDELLVNQYVQDTLKVTEEIKERSLSEDSRIIINDLKREIRNNNAKVQINDSDIVRKEIKILSELYDKGRYTNILEISTKLIADNASSISQKDELRALKVRVLFAENSNDEAIKVISSITIGSKFRLYSMIRLNLSRHNYTKSFINIEKLKKLFPNDNYSLIFEADYYIKTRDFEKAIQLLEDSGEVKSEFKQYGIAYSLLSQAYIEIDLIKCIKYSLEVYIRNNNPDAYLFYAQQFTNYYTSEVDLFIDIDKIKEVLVKVEKLKFHYLDHQTEEIYWWITLTLHLVCGVDIDISEMSPLPEAIEKNDDVLLALYRVLSMMGQTDFAEKVFKKISTNSLISKKTNLRGLFSNQKWKEVLEYFNNSFNENEVDFIDKTICIIAKYHLTGFHSIRHELIQSMNSVRNSVGFRVKVFKMILENEPSLFESEALFFLDMLDDFIDEELNELIGLSNVEGFPYEKMTFFIKISSNPSMIDFYLYKHLPNESDFRLYEELLKLYKSGMRTKNLLKTLIIFSRNNGLKFLVEILDVYANEYGSEVSHDYYRYEYGLLNDDYEIKANLEIAIRQNNKIIDFLALHMYSVEEKIRRIVDHSVNCYLRYIDEFTYEDMSNFIATYMRIINNKELENILLCNDYTKESILVTLNNDGLKKDIILQPYREFIKHGINELNGVPIYNDSQDEVLLIGNVLRVGEPITFGGSEWDVTEVQHLFPKLIGNIHLLLETVHSERNDGIRYIKGNPEEATNEIIELLDSRRTENRERIANYNNIEHFGIPISNVFGKNIRTNYSTFLHFSSLKGQNIYTGDVAESNSISNDVFVISLNSLYIMKHYGFLKLLASSNIKIIVPEVILDKIEEQIRKLKGEMDIETKSIHKSEDSGIVYSESGKEQNLEEIKFWKDVRSSVNKMIISSDYDMSVPNTIMENILLSDYEIAPMLLSKSSGYSLILDDLSTIRMFQYFYDDKSVNSFSLLYKILDISPLFIEIILRSITDGIVYSLNEHILTEIIEYCVKKNSVELDDMVSKLVGELSRNSYYSGILKASLLSLGIGEKIYILHLIKEPNHHNKN